MLTDLLDFKTKITEIRHFIEVDNLFSFKFKLIECQSTQLHI